MRHFCPGSVREITKQPQKSGFISPVPVETMLCGHFRPLSMLHLIHGAVFLGQSVPVVFSNFQQMEVVDAFSGRGSKL